MFKTMAFSLNTCTQPGMPMTTLCGTDNVGLMATRHLRHSP